MNDKEKRKRIKRKYATNDKIELNDEKDYYLRKKIAMKIDYEDFHKQKQKEQKLSHLYDRVKIKKLNLNDDFEIKESKKTQNSIDADTLAAKYTKKIMEEYKERYYGTYTTFISLATLLIIISAIIIFPAEDIWSAEKVLEMGVTVLFLLVLLLFYNKKASGLQSQLESELGAVSKRVQRHIDKHEERVCLFHREESFKNKIVSSIENGNLECLKAVFAKLIFALKVPFTTYIRIQKEREHQILSVFLPSKHIIPNNMFILNGYRRLEVYEKTEKELTIAYDGACTLILLSILTVYVNCFGMETLPDLLCNAYIADTDGTEECLSVFFTGKFTADGIRYLVRMCNEESRNRFATNKNNTASYGINDSKVYRLLQSMSADGNQKKAVLPMALLKSLQVLNISSDVLRTDRKYTWEELYNVYETKASV